MVISRAAAKRIVLETSFGFETQMMYVTHEGVMPTVWLPEFVRGDKQASREFRDPATGRLQPPNKLCVLIPNPIQAEPLITNRTNQLTPRNHPEPFDWSMPVPASWRVAPDVFADADALMDLIDLYGLKVKRRDDRWIVQANTAPRSKRRRGRTPSCFAC